MFKITVEEKIPKDPANNYGTDFKLEEIYTQMVADIDLVAIINAVNSKEKK